MRNRRTYLGPVETGPVVYREIGWSYTTTNPAPLFGRDLIPGGDSLAANQQYRVRVDLFIGFAPLAPVAVPELFPAWPGSSGQASIENISLSTIAAAGTTSALNYTVDPGNINNASVFISTSSLALRAPVLGQSLSLAGSVIYGGTVRRAYSPGDTRGVS